MREQRPISGAIDVLNTNLPQIATVSEWADRMGYKDTNKFRLEILVHFKKSPIKLLNKVRLSKAKKMLASNRNYSCFEIAISIGLKHEKDLHNFFYYHENNPPTYFRESE